MSRKDKCQARFCLAFYVHALPAGCRRVTAMRLREICRMFRLLERSAGCPLAKQVCRSLREKEIAAKIVVAAFSFAVSILTQVTRVLPQRFPAPPSKRNRHRSCRPTKKTYQNNHTTIPALQQSERGGRMLLKRCTMPVLRRLQTAGCRVPILQKLWLSQVRLRHCQKTPKRSMFALQIIFTLRRYTRSPVTCESARNAPGARLPG